MPRRRSLQTLLTLFAAETVVDLPTIQTALGGVSAMTVGRWLRQVPSRRSYNQNGRYYALHEPDRYDRHGLWSYGDIHFAVDGSLKDTVRRMVIESEAGMTHQELAARLCVRVHNPLLGLVRETELARVQSDGVYHYVHPELSVQQEQIRRRQLRLTPPTEDVSVADDAVIRVLLVMLRHPGVRPSDVVRHLKGRSPPITRDQVDLVFTRYGLGEKGGPRIY